MGEKSGGVSPVEKRPPVAFFSSVLSDAHTEQLSAVFWSSIRCARSIPDADQRVPRVVFAPCSPLSDALTAHEQSVVEASRSVRNTLLFPLLRIRTTLPSSDKKPAAYLLLKGT